ncbi:ArsA family ATPase [Kitasatospora sp. NPDC096147]|uniref:ArsA family ATPase n=1 Tax=Kitasatospora sp. NPDC096147 TaxID=3364093 RepID=UPI003800CD2F
MRTILVSGDGAELVAAATALHHAGRGRPTHLLAADDPHRAMDTLLGVRLTAEPARYADALTVARTDPQAAFEDAVQGFQDALGPALDLLGATALDREELTALPGTAQLALLRALRTTEAGVLVVAAPRPAELIAALALPEQLERHLARLLPEQRQAARALRPLLAAVAGVPMPADWLFEARGRAAAALAGARAVIEAPTTTVRLVVDAAAPRPGELRRARAGLALHRLRLDAVVAHRALPAAALDSADPWLAGRAARERDELAALAGELDVPLLISRQPEPALEEVAAQLHAGAAPAVAEHPWWVEDRLAEDGLLVWHLTLPGADRAELDLVRRGDELVLGLGDHRRIVPLPSALRRCTVRGAGLTDGLLSVRFAPDHDLWPRG